MVPGNLEEKNYIPDSIGSGGELRQGNAGLELVLEHWEWGVVEQALWERDWPQPNPTAPPTKKQFAALSPDKLVPYVLGDKEIDPDDNDLIGRDGCRVACAWFIWKTKDIREGAVLRQRLADAIVEKLHVVEKDKTRMLHDYSHLASFLGPLGARKHALQLMKEVRGFDCCYGPALVRAVGMAGIREDVPALIEAITKESEACGGVVNEALARLTGHRMSLTGRGYTDRAAWSKWWAAQKESKPSTQ
jgi:hypothetical protein